MRFPVWSDERMERIISMVLVAGMVLAAVVTLSGGVLYLHRHGQASPQYEIFQGQPADLRSVSGIVADARAGKARGIIQLGLLLLIATPIARVIFSVAAFALRRDFIYVIVTLIVLTVLLYSLAGGSF